MATKLTIKLSEGKDFHLLFELEEAATDYKGLIAKHGFICTETKERFFPDQIESIELKEYNAETEADREESAGDQGTTGEGDDPTGSSQEV